MIFDPDPKNYLELFTIATDPVQSFPRILDLFFEREGVVGCPEMSSCAVSPQGGLVCRPWALIDQIPTQCLFYPQRTV